MSRLRVAAARAAWAARVALAQSPAMSMTRWALVTRLRLLLLAMLLPLLAQPVLAQSRVLVVRAAQAVALPQPSAAPPAGDTAAELVALPDDWSISRPGHAGATWYRFDFPAPPVPPDELPVLYIPRACHNVEVFLNGSRIARGGRMSLPYTRHCYESMVVALPSGLLMPQRNRLELQVVGHPLERVAARQRAAGLSELYIGSQSLLQPASERQRFWNVTAAQVVAVTLVVLGLFVIGIGWVRDVSYLLHFGVVCLGWAALSARVWWLNIPFPNEVVEFVICTAFVVLGVSGTLFLLRYAGVPPSRREWLLWSQCIVAPLLMLAAGPDRLFMLAAAFYTLLAAQVIGAAGIYLWTAWREQRSERWVMAGILGLLALAIAAEVAIQDLMLPLPQVHMIHFAMPLLFVAIAFRLVQVFVQALRHAERARGEFDQRMRDATAEMERGWAAMTEQRVEQMAERERKRIAGDLHDDLGAKLLTIVHTSDNDRISQLAREALEEMRLSVKGLTGKPVQLSDALADWRAETVSRLGAAGIEIEWQSEDALEPRTLSARGFVGITRILREATSNLIKHSGASRCTVRSTVDEDFHLVIRDNGRGIPVELDGKLDRGHGMYSMKHRAKQIQGQCLVESGPGYGTVIRLTVPL